MFKNKDKFKNKYRISSLRLKKWDYSSSGYYYITICNKNRQCIFGDIINNSIRLFDIGKIIKNNWELIPKHYNNVALDEYTIMPNHIHGIIVIRTKIKSPCRDAINRVSTNNGGITKELNPMGKQSVGEIIRYFKGKSTFDIHKIYPHFSWQSRYYDHIIRSEKSLEEIRFYIRFNHCNWNTDEENPNK